MTDLAVDSFRLLNGGLGRETDLPLHHLLAYLLIQRAFPVANIGVPSWINAYADAVHFQDVHAARVPFTFPQRATPRILDRVTMRAV
ncbi:MAG: hypothetical protein LBB86_00125, partial [Oscillospiraceae bacterium]|nr:hypothetical protein [Oscillospiraceae bacterium]